MEGAITGSPEGFFVNGRPAEPGVNFFVEYGTLNLPTLDLPTLDAPLMTAVNDILNTLNG